MHGVPHIKWMSSPGAICACREAKVFVLLMYALFLAAAASTITIEHHL